MPPGVRRNPFCGRTLPPDDLFSVLLFCHTASSFSIPLSGKEVIKKRPAAALAGMGLQLRAGVRVCRFRLQESKGQAALSDPSGCQQKTKGEDFLPKPLPIGLPLLPVFPRGVIRRPVLFVFFSWGVPAVRAASAALKSSSVGKPAPGSPGKWGVPDLSPVNPPRTP